MARGSVTNTGGRRPATVCGLHSTCWRLPIERACRSAKGGTEVAGTPEAQSARPCARLEIDGDMLTQSLAIIEYLAETRPACGFLPADPLGARACARCPTRSPWTSTRSAISASSPMSCSNERSGCGARGLDAQVHRRRLDCLRTPARPSGNRRFLPWRPAKHGRSLPRTADLQCPPLECRSLRLSTHTGNCRQSGRIETLYKCTADFADKNDVTSPWSSVHLVYDDTNIKQLIISRRPT